MLPNSVLMSASSSRSLPIFYRSTLRLLHILVQEGFPLGPIFVYIVPGNDCHRGETPERYRIKTAVSSTTVFLDFPLTQSSEPAISA
jgi:hypothetical protein